MWRSSRRLSGGFSKNKGIKALNLIILFLFFSLNISSVSSGPFWMKKGFYVRYVIPKGSYTGFIISRVVSSKNESVTYMKLYGKEFVNATYSWKVLELEDNMAKVRVVFKASIGRNGTEKMEKSLIVLVNVDTRDVYTPEGKYLGKIAWWLQDVKHLSRVIVYGKPPVQVNATVYEYEKKVKTPLGDYKCWVAILDKHPVYLFLSQWFFYDQVTGLLVAIRTNTYYDVVLNYMNITAINLPYTKGVKIKMFVDRIEGVEQEKNGFSLSEYKIYLIAIGLIVSAITLIIYGKKYRKNR